MENETGETISITKRTKSGIFVGHTKPTHKSQSRKRSGQKSLSCPYASGAPLSNRTYYADVLTLTHCAKKESCVGVSI